MVLFLLVFYYGGPHVSSQYDVVRYASDRLPPLHSATATLPHSPESPTVSEAEAPPRQWRLRRSQSPHLPRRGWRAWRASFSTRSSQGPARAPQRRSPAPARASAPPSPTTPSGADSALRTWGSTRPSIRRASLSPLSRFAMLDLGLSFFFSCFPPLSRFELTEERAAHLRESIVDSSSVMVLVNCFCSLCLEYRMIRFFLSCIVATEFNFRIYDKV